MSKWCVAWDVLMPLEIYVIHRKLCKHISKFLATSLGQFRKLETRVHRMDFGKLSLDSQEKLILPGLHRCHPKHKLRPRLYTQHSVAILSKRWQPFCLWDRPLTLENEHVDQNHAQDDSSHLSPCWKIPWEKHYDSFRRIEQTRYRFVLVWWAPMKIGCHIAQIQYACLSNFRFPLEFCTWNRA